MKNSLKIRKASEFDLDSLNNLNSKSFEELTKKLDFFNFFNKKNYEIIVATKEKNVVGYLLSLNVTENLFEIISIAVDSYYRKRGIGSLLMSDFLGNKEVNSKIILEVANKNIAAIRLYKNFLFDIDGIRKDYYKDPIDDAFLMSRII
ncbi:MAG: hypothetical protein CL762_04570 [Chloroflexi bacterium]|nr:hypothetical protein [Chloroflexota bacterium]